MRGIKIPQQDFALKMQGGLCARGGVFAGHYGKCLVYMTFDTSLTVLNQFCRR